MLYGLKFQLFILPWTKIENYEKKQHIVMLVYRQNKTANLFRVSGLLWLYAYITFIQGNRWSSLPSKESGASRHQKR